MEFQARELFANTSTLARAPVYLGLFLVVRGLPALVVYVRILGLRQRAALGILQSTALPLLVVIVQIALATLHVLPVNAAALVRAGMVSVLLYPFVGFAVAGKDAGPIRQELLDFSDPARDFL
jgi:hypothetical protein